MSTSLQKYKLILEEFSQRADKTITPYDEILQEKLSLSPKQIGRLLDEIHLEYNNIIIIENQKRKTYKMLKPVDLFIEIFQNFDELGWLFSIAKDKDSDIFKELEKYTIPDTGIYKFKNTPLEDLDTISSRSVFKTLKLAIKNKERRKIKLIFDNKTRDNLKCLKLIFMDNNWYVAVVGEENILEFIRISFIETVEYASKLSFQHATIQKQLNFINQNIQNSLTLYDRELKTATIKANPNIAKYFNENMKIFLSSQKFIKKQKDGSIIFEIKYTQSLEVLTLIQKWLPDLIIISPKELKEKYENKLKQALKNCE